MRLPFVESTLILKKCADQLSKFHVGKFYAFNSCSDHRIDELTIGILLYNLTYLIELPRKYPW